MLREVAQPSVSGDSEVGESVRTWLLFLYFPLRVWEYLMPLSGLSQVDMTVMGSCFVLECVVPGLKKGNESWGRELGYNRMLVRPYPYNQSHWSSILPTVGRRAH